MEVEGQRGRRGEKGRERERGGRGEREREREHTNTGISVCCGYTVCGCDQYCLCQHVIMFRLTINNGVGRSLKGNLFQTVNF